MPVCKNVVIVVKIKVKINVGAGCAIAQAVSHWLAIAAALVRSRVKSCGFCGGQNGTGVNLSEYFGFPYQTFH
jgi:hypothetical protein